MDIEVRTRVVRPDAVIEEVEATVHHGPGFTYIGIGDPHRPLLEDGDSLHLRQRWVDGRLESVEALVERPL